MDQLPMDMLLLIAEHLLADDILALLLTTKSLWQISGSSFWLCYFRAKKLQSPYFDNNTDFTTPAKLVLPLTVLMMKFITKPQDRRQVARRQISSEVRDQTQ
jgi:hypothetical protein